MIKSVSHNSHCYISLSLTEVKKKNKKKNNAITCKCLMPERPM